MASTSDFRNGLIIKFKNDLFSIVEFNAKKSENRQSLRKYFQSRGKS
jgi:translation elongation factor P/translation initiation factor 5A